MRMTTKTQGVNGRAVDMYALGILLYWLLLAFPPDNMINPLQWDPIQADKMWFQHLTDHFQNHPHSGECSWDLPSDKVYHEMYQTRKARMRTGRKLPEGVDELQAQLVMAESERDAWKEKYEAVVAMQGDQQAEWQTLGDKAISYPSAYGPEPCNGRCRRLSESKSKKELCQLVNTAVEAMDKDLDDPTYHWYRISVGEGIFAYKNVITGYALDHFHDQSIEALDDDMKHHHHQWQEIEVGDGYFALKNRGAEQQHCWPRHQLLNHAYHQRSSKHDQGSVEAEAIETESAASQWVCVPLGNGLVAFKNLFNHEWLCQLDETFVTTSTCHESPRSQWEYVIIRQGCIALRNRESGKALEYYRGRSIRVFNDDISVSSRHWITSFVGLHSMALPETMPGVSSPPMVSSSNEPAMPPCEPNPSLEPCATETPGIEDTVLTKTDCRIALALLSHGEEEQQGDDDPVSSRSEAAQRIVKATEVATNFHVANKRRNMHRLCGDMKQPLHYLSMPRRVVMGKMARKPYAGVVFLDPETLRASSKPTFESPGQIELFGAYFALSKVEEAGIKAHRVTVQVIDITKSTQAFDRMWQVMAELRFPGFRKKRGEFGVASSMASDVNHAREYFSQWVKMKDEFNGYLITDYAPLGTYAEYIQKLARSTVEQHAQEDPNHKRFATVLRWQQKALRLFAKVVEAVNFMHSRGVCHLNLTPSTIKIGDHHNPLIVGMYDAEIMDGYWRVGRNRCIPYTKYYSPLEVIAHNISPDKAQGVDGPGIDRYALGVMLYWSLFSCPPDGWVEWDPVTRDPKWLHNLVQHMNKAHSGDDETCIICQDGMLLDGRVIALLQGLLTPEATKRVSADEALVMIRDAIDSL
ncbi:hypothetical protein Poli38472_004366 [Pythium oligandrum]|uniref:non-specific serine/threonine protein kinase n=1 Tax=Pythium oligandrum TaxID=41045 RepID=A0A8K1FH20_PYTOL|nr:hypothetical protein Poli38472_004366 [Pythium oligandrum]|eukprot:TMW59297.1 hypothetical protein Poli38472_004366 [Pythium oligandrum]